MTRRPSSQYTRSSRITAVIAADMTSATAASKATGIPARTIRNWQHNPELAELALRSREDLADGARALAQKALVLIDEKLPRFGPRDLAIVFGILVDKSQLLSGAATARMESRDLTGTISDVELAAAIREAEALLSGTPLAIEAETEP